MIEVLQGMNAEAGFKFKANVVDHTSEFPPRYRDARGQHEGPTYKQGPRPSEDPAARTEFDFYSKSGPNFLGFDANGSNTQAGDPKVDEILNKARGEVDEKKRKALLQELQNYLAKTHVRHSLARWHLRPADGLAGDPELQRLPSGQPRPAVQLVA